MTPTVVRPAAVAGTFYPADPEELAALVDEDLAAVTLGRSEPAPKAIVVPHAGYVYSGPVAAHAYARLRSLRAVTTRVVIFGPAHRVAVRGLAISGAEAFETPLGTVPIDDTARRHALTLAQVHVDNRAHALEHSLEVQLPFLQRALGEFTLVPFAVGDAATDQVAEVIDLLWGGPETLVVVSSDLSHYLTYEEATARDAATAAAVVSGNFGDIGTHDACGAVPLRGLLMAAAERGLDTEMVDLANSGDTAGPRDQVVGYGAFVMGEHA